jgi:hypothetical protein
MRVALAIAVLVALALPEAALGARCNIRGDERRLGPTYVTTLNVRGVSCATGRRVVRAYHRCRFRNGGKDGRCRSRVSRYRCSERRSGIRTQFNGRVRCTRGRRVVSHTYTQFT